MMQLWEGARLLQVIETNILVRGAGTEADPRRKVTQYWSTDGTLLAERDGPPTTGFVFQDCKWDEVQRG